MNYKIALIKLNCKKKNSTIYKVVLMKSNLTSRNKTYKELLGWLNFALNKENLYIFIYKNEKILKWFLAKGQKFSDLLFNLLISHHKLRMKKVIYSRNLQYKKAIRFVKGIQK